MRIHCLLLALLALPLAAQDIAVVEAGGDIGGAGELAELLTARGRDVIDIGDAMRAGELPLAGRRALVLGSFVTGDAAVRGTLAAHRGELADWIASGGVVVELCQADQHEQYVTWLPPGLLVSRADPDYPAIEWARPDHPLATTPHAMGPELTSGWKFRGWSIAWEALTAWHGFEAIATCGNGAAAVVEASHGQGRILISAIPPDTMARQGEGDSPRKAEAFFDNLLAYIDQMAAGEGVALRPTPTVPLLTRYAETLNYGVLAAEGSGLPALLAEVGPAPRVLAAPPTSPAELPVVLLDAGAAEGLAAAEQAALQQYLEAGGVVVELHQNAELRPAWLPAELGAARGGHPGDFVVPALEGHPLFTAPNPLTGVRRQAWREGDRAIARQGFTRLLGWGVVARFGGETSPAAVIERAVGAGRVIVVAADPAAAAAGDDLPAENARAFLANLLAYAAGAARGQIALAEPLELPEREFMYVGRQIDGSVMVPTEQLIVPAGRQVEFPGRPVDLALLPDGRLAIVDRNHLRLLDVDDAEVEHSAAIEGGHSVTGIAVSRDGRRLFTSSSKTFVQEWRIDDAGALSPGERLEVPGGTSAGLALSADDSRLYVCSSRGNRLVVFDLAGGGEPQTVDVGVAPYDVARAAGKLYVTNWGGPRPTPGEGPTARTSGSLVSVDGRTIANRGSVHVIAEDDLRVVTEIEVGLLPSGVAVGAGGRRLFVANANSDTVSVIDTATDTVVESIGVKPVEALPFGSAANALALSPDGTRLYVCNGTNNAVAQVTLSGAARGGDGPAQSSVDGFIPVGWFPGGIAVAPDGRAIYVANTKGVGSLAQAERHNSHHHLGSVSLVPLPDADELAALTAQVARNNNLNKALAGLEPPRPDAPARPLPERHGEPSPIEHVVYIIRENRTYDQVMGDMPQGNGDPALVHFGREVTPNSHALAEQFVLLDNFYCSGILSADGHQWTDEAYASSYLEKMFGGFFRSYPYAGDDALAYAPSGFIWDNCLEHGRTFRTYGEMVQARVVPKEEGAPLAFKPIYDDFVDNGVMDRYSISATAQIEALQRNMCETTIGFPSIVPDIYRAAEFIRELREFEANGKLPNLSIILLPNDHTVGTRPGFPTPSAAVADNDRAVGLIVEALTHSPYWPKTAIFICQDDPQAGVDHVDGHRSPAFVISPYTPRGKVISANYTQVGMVKTIELILGLPPMNQLDLAAEPMRACFQDEPDLTPFVALPNEIPLDQLNPPLNALSPTARRYAEQSMEEPLDEIDEADEDTLNRILWHFCKGDTPYPTLARRFWDEDEGDDDD